MMVLKKILASVVLAIVLLFVLIQFVLTPAFLKPIIQEKVETFTGYHLRLEGDLSWHFFPYIGVNVDKLSLTLPNKSILTLTGITIGLTFSSLLHQVFEPTHVTVDHASYELSHDGRIQLNRVYITRERFTADFYQGTIEVDGLVNFQPSLQFDLHATVSNTALGPLLQDLTGKSYLSGTFSGNSHLTGESLDSLTGDAHTTITQGELQFDAVNHIAQQAMLIIGQPSTQENNIRLFDQITTEATIHQGIAEITTDLSAKHYHAHGTGKTNLNDLSIDMMIHAYDQHHHTAIPIRIQGPLGNPKVEIPLSTVLGDDLSTLAGHLQQLFHS